MKKTLKKTLSGVYHFKDGNKIEGLHSGLRGDVSGLRGDVSGLRGDISGLRGDISGLRGNATGLRGNIDTCELTDEDRRKGVDVKDLIA